MNKKTIIILIIIILATSIALGFWYVNNSQKLGMNTNTEKQEDKTKLIQDFEDFIKNHGKKIELEKIDTTDWKTYIDKKRGFSFKYPKDWYVVEIDSSKEKEDYYSPKSQKIEKSILKRGATDCDKKFTDPATIKGCAKTFDILCIVDKYKYEELPKKLTQTTDGFSNKQIL